MNRRLKQPCSFENLGLTDAEGASLTGFTTPAIKALAHLREAWSRADADNARAIEEALRVLLTGHSFVRNREIVLKVLTYGLDEPQRLLKAIDPKGC